MHLLSKTHVTRFVWKLSFVGGLGGFLFGYDTGVIGGALLYIRDDFQEVDENVGIQEAIVSTAIAGAVVGAAIGGHASDRLGRKLTMMFADVVFVIGAIVMAASKSPLGIIIGRVLVGVGIGVASMASPLYIAEASPAQVRGALVTMNNILITGGQFVAYLVNLAFTKVPGTWRWMLGVAAVPAVVQFVALLFCPESPRWLYRKGKVDASHSVMSQIYPPEQVEDEMVQLAKSMENESGITKPGYRDLFKSKEIRLALVAGVGLQIFQQFVGINTVMYYAPTIFELAGYASHRTAILLSLVTSGLNMVGSVVGIFAVDRIGRRRLVLTSLFGVIMALAVLTGGFYKATLDTPMLVPDASLSRFACPKYSVPSSNLFGKDRCLQCLDHDSCGFCAAAHSKLGPGVCLVANKTVGTACGDQSRSWFTQGCPSSAGWFALVGLAFYICAFSPGMGPIPWVVNSEIYPLHYRGKCGGMAAMANWTANLVVAQSFLSLTKAIGTYRTFAVYGVIAVLAVQFVCCFVPETKGLSMEAMGEVWQRRAEAGWRSCYGRRKRGAPSRCCCGGGGFDNGDEQEDDARAPEEGKPSRIEDRPTEEGKVASPGDRAPDK